MCCPGCVSDIFLVCLLVLFPPLPVWIRRGLCLQDSLINILLCCLGYFPGLIHAWYIIAKYPPYEETKVYYVYRLDLEHQVPRRAGDLVIIYTNEPDPRPQPPYLISSSHQVVEHLASAGASQPLNEGQANYGATNDRKPINNNPPAYSESS